MQFALLMYWALFQHQSLNYLVTIYSISNTKMLLLNILKCCCYSYKTSVDLFNVKAKKGNYTQPVVFLKQGVEDPLVVLVIQCSSLFPVLHCSWLTEVDKSKSSLHLKLYSRFYCLFFIVVFFVVFFCLMFMSGEAKWKINMKLGIRSIFDIASKKLLLDHNKLLTEVSHPIQAAMSSLSYKCYLYLLSYC